MKLSNVLWGLLLVVLGVIFGLNALDITNINVFFEGWWTLFIIVPCFIDLFKSESKTGNLIGLGIGICLLLACQNILSFSILWKLAFPVILVVIGLSLIFKDTINGKVKKEIKRLNAKSGNGREYCATFGGQDLSFAGEVLESCSLTAVFGGVKCDLVDANICEDVVINVSAIFGGVTIMVPEGVHVKINSTPIFGGVSDERRGKHQNKDANRTIYINATCMFGGVDIQ